MYCMHSTDAHHRRLLYLSEFLSVMQTQYSSSEKPPSPTFCSESLGRFQRDLPITMFSAISLPGSYRHTKPISAIIRSARFYSYDITYDKIMEGKKRRQGGKQEKSPPRPCQTSRPKPRSHEPAIVIVVESACREREREALTVLQTLENSVM